MTNIAHFFIAIPIDSSLRGMLKSWQSDLQELLPYKQWTHEMDLHITLKFLGPVEGVRLTKLKEALYAVEDIETFSVDVEKVGAFGNPEKPRVLWAGVSKNESINTLQKLVENIASEHGFQPERRAYRPHITLAKKWNSSVADHSLDTTKNLFSDKQQFTVDRVVIFQIFPARSPKYEVIAEYRLKEGD
ncbi:RNA 2',3'-cyclic phosphodiesterase [Virgibacillus byunsanensis]|uniref:RNA 2',3'-cyclic phosphodiesterase n=1 Tax=Virgibacillus byunsanensis TaxID=570945 RepID=A0ABW3LLP1_9BACI